MAFKRISVTVLIVALALANVALGTPVPNHLSGASHDSHLASSTQDSLGSAQHQARSLGLLARDQDPISKTKSSDPHAAKNSDGHSQDDKKESGIDQNDHAAQQAQDAKSAGANPKEGPAAITNANAQIANKSLELKAPEPNNADHTQHQSPNEAKGNPPTPENNAPTPEGHPATEKAAPSTIENHPGATEAKSGPAPKAADKKIEAKVGQPNTDDEGH